MRSNKTSLQTDASHIMPIKCKLPGHFIFLHLIMATLIGLFSRKQNIGKNKKTAIHVMHL